MVRTGNIGLVKKMNKHIVLNIIRENENISRAEIAKITGLNKATVSALVDELIEEHFVSESGIGVSTGGRRPLMLRFNEEAGSLIGIELGVNYIYAILTNLDATIIWEKTCFFSPIEKQETIIEKIISIIDEAIHHAPNSPYGVMGIGIGVPGIVNKEEGLVVFAPNLHWDHVSLAAVLQKQWPDYPIIIENEAKLAALGEKWFGAGKDFTNLVYVSAGIGIGSGIIIHNQLYRGIDGIAGEVGHHVIDIHGIQCSCGNYGCWEMYASEKYIKRRLEQENKHSLLKDFSIEKICLLAESGDRQMAQILEEVGRYLGIGLLNIIYAYNPEAVIIGNTIGKAGKWVLEPARDEVQKRLLVKDGNFPFIMQSQLLEKSCAIGAVASILEKIVIPPEVEAISQQ
jgi:glucokinase-like ROK family protein